MLFHDRVKFLLDKKRISQLRFAGMLGISAARLNNYLTGKTEANYAVLKAVSHLLNTTSDYLLGVKPGHLSQSCGLLPEFFPGYTVTEYYGPEKSFGDFSTRVRCLLKERSMTQSALASETGAAPAMISNYIAGRVEAGYDMLVRMAACLNTTVDYLLGLSPDSGEDGYPRGAEALYAGIRGVSGETYIELPVFDTADGKKTGGFLCLGVVKSIYTKPYILSVGDGSMSPVCEKGDMLFVAPRTYISPVKNNLNPSGLYAVRLCSRDTVGTAVRYCLTKDDVIFLRPADTSFETFAYNYSELDYMPVSGIILGKLKKKD